MSDEWAGIPQGVRVAAIHARDRGAQADVVRCIEMPGETVGTGRWAGGAFYWGRPSTVRFWVPAKVKVTGTVSPEVAVALTLAGFRERDGSWVWDSKHWAAQSTG